MTASARPQESNARGGESRKNPRGGRLLRHADFERVYKQGRRHFATHMTVFYLRRLEGEGMRVGFTVGRVLGDAAPARRGIARTLDVVINPRKSLRTVEFSVLLGEVSKAFEVIAQKMRSGG